MIVRNEETCLGSCLASVKDFVDEMVLLDTGSSDSTISIAEAAGAIVEQIPWPGDFAPARNTALEFVKGDWVLVLDADEQLCAECIPQLKSLMALENVLLVNLLRFEKGSTMSPYSNVSRLFRRQGDRVRGGAAREAPARGDGPAAPEHLRIQRLRHGSGGLPRRL